MAPWLHDRGRSGGSKASGRGTHQENTGRAQARGAQPALGQQNGIEEWMRDPGDRRDGGREPITGDRVHGGSPGRTGCSQGTRTF